MSSAGPQQQQIKSSTAPSSSSSSAYDAFTSVDELVAKPVLGSDGALKWQDFQKDNKCSSASIINSVAPALPAKKVDRIIATTSTSSTTTGGGRTNVDTTTTTSSSLDALRKERINEQKIRKEAGKASLGEGYTTFKRKIDHNEIALQKKHKNIMDRIRPDDKKYFIESKTFIGHKHDYIFTTRTPGRGTGYYWDGMDSIKDLSSSGRITTSSTTHDNGDDEKQTKMKIKKQKKKKKKNKNEEYVPIFVQDDGNNPFDQVNAAIQRRNQITRNKNNKVMQTTLPHNITTTTTTNTQQQQLPQGWEQTIDVKSNKPYYFNRQTNEISWTIPTTNTSTTKMTTTTTLTEEAKTNKNDNTTTTITNNTNQEQQTTTTTTTTTITTTTTTKIIDLPNGWEKSIDPNTNKTYYYCRKTGERSWDIPTNSTTKESCSDNNDNKNNKQKEGEEEEEEEEEEKGQDCSTNNNSSSNSCWKVTIDPNTRKEYYYNTKTGETKWNM